MRNGAPEGGNPLSGVVFPFHDEKDAPGRCGARQARGVVSGAGSYKKERMPAASFSSRLIRRFAISFELSSAALY